MHLLIAAAGSGTRMGAKCNKLLLPLAGRPLLAWTLDAALASKSIEWIGVVGQPCDKAEILPLLQGFEKTTQWIVGGATRQESVQRGLAELKPGTKYVLIHDGARCLVEPELFDKCSKAVIEGNAVIAATPVSDTIKEVDESRMVVRTPDRSRLWAAQTPQGFSVEELKEGHSEALKNKWVVTDDASLNERLGWPVRILDSASSNIKVTTPFDLTIAEAVLATRR